MGKRGGGVAKVTFLPRSPVIYREMTSEDLQVFLCI